MGRSGSPLPAGAACEPPHPAGVLTRALLLGRPLAAARQIMAIATLSLCYNNHNVFSGARRLLY